VAELEQRRPLPGPGRAGGPLSALVEERIDLVVTSWRADARHVETDPGSVVEAYRVKLI
jgi:hypothetical protein